MDLSAISGGNSGNFEGVPLLAISLEYLLEFAKKVPIGHTTAKVYADYVEPSETSHGTICGNLVPSHFTSSSPGYCVAHSWLAPFGELVSTLHEYFTTENVQNPQDVFLWVDVFDRVDQGPERALLAARELLFIVDTKYCSLRTPCSFRMLFLASHELSKKIVFLAHPSLRHSGEVDLLPTQGTTVEHETEHLESLASYPGGLEFVRTVAKGVLVSGLTGALVQRVRAYCLLAPCSSDPAEVCRKFGRYVHLLYSCGDSSMASSLLKAVTSVSNSACAPSLSSVNEVSLQEFVRLTGGTAASCTYPLAIAPIAVKERQAAAAVTCSNCSFTPEVTETTCCRDSESDSLGSTGAQDFGSVLSLVEQAPVSGVVKQEHVSNCNTPAGDKILDERSLGPMQVAVREGLPSIQSGLGTAIPSLKRAKGQLSRPAVPAAGRIPARLQPFESKHQQHTGVANIPRGIIAVPPSAPENIPPVCVSPMLAGFIPAIPTGRFVKHERCALSQRRWNMGRVAAASASVHKTPGSRNPGNSARKNSAPAMFPPARTVETKLEQPLSSTSATESPVMIVSTGDKNHYSGSATSLSAESSQPELSAYVGLADDSLSYDINMELAKSVPSCSWGIGANVASLPRLSLDSTTLPGADVATGQPTSPKPQSLRVSSHALKQTSARRSRSAALHNINEQMNYAPSPLNPHHTSATFIAGLVQPPPGSSGYPPYVMDVNDNDCFLPQSRCGDFWSLPDVSCIPQGLGTQRWSTASFAEQPSPPAHETSTGTCSHCSAQDNCHATVTPENSRGGGWTNNASVPPTPENSKGAQSSRSVQPTPENSKGAWSTNSFPSTPENSKGAGHLASMAPTPECSFWGGVLAEQPDIFALADAWNSEDYPPSYWAKLRANQNNPEAAQAEAQRILNLDSAYQQRFMSPFQQNSLAPTLKRPSQGHQPANSPAKLTTHSLGAEHFGSGLPAHNATAGWSAPHAQHSADDIIGAPPRPSWGNTAISDQFQNVPMMLGLAESSQSNALAVLNQGSQWRVCTTPEQSVSMPLASRMQGGGESSLAQPPTSTLALRSISCGANLTSPLAFDSGSLGHDKTKLAATSPDITGVGVANNCPSAENSGNVADVCGPPATGSQPGLWRKTPERELHTVFDDSSSLPPATTSFESKALGWRAGNTATPLFGSHEASPSQPHRQCLFADLNKAYVGGMGDGGGGGSGMLDFDVSGDLWQALEDVLMEDGMSLNPLLLNFNEQNCATAMERN